MSEQSELHTGSTSQAAAAHTGSDNQLRELLEQYATEYSAQKAAEKTAESHKKACSGLAKQLEPFFATHKTLATDNLQLTRSVPESWVWDTDRAVNEKPALRAMLAPYASTTYDVKKAIDETPVLAGLLEPYRSLKTGSPRITATLKAQA